MPQKEEVMCTLRKPWECYLDGVVRAGLLEEVTFKFTHTNVAALRALQAEGRQERGTPKGAKA